jgi:ribosomal protein S27AE
MQIAKTCPNCGEIVSRELVECPRCGTVIKELHQTRLAEVEVAKQRTLRERDSNDLYVDKLEAVHTERRKFGILFWGIVFIIVLGLCGLALLSPLIVEQIIGQR